MEIFKALKQAENSLRDFIQYCLINRFGRNWIEDSGLEEKKIQQWRQRQAENSTNFPRRSPENLIHFAPFDDLPELVEMFWDSDLSSAFGDKTVLLTYLKIMSQYRHPDLHRRELFIYQKHLLLGITGEIKAKISAYRSFREIGKTGFPRIDFVKDNLGNKWAPGDPMHVRTGMTIHSGDQLEFVVEASDPEELPIEYRIHGEKWQPGNILIFNVQEQHVQKNAHVNITIRSTRKFHAYPLGYDDRVVFLYQVLPGQK